MGATYVDVTIRNPAAPAKSWTGRFLVDPGAFATGVTAGTVYDASLPLY